jgi:SAM-dependent methyltransferase
MQSSTSAGSLNERRYPGHPGNIGLEEMFKVKYLNERFDARLNDIELLDKSIRSIRPSDSSLVEWYEDYALGNRERLAHDLEIISDHVPAELEIAEFGSVPLLLTVSLKHRGYHVTGIDIDPDRFHESVLKHNLLVAKCDIEHETLPFPDAHFGAAIFNELFEHLRQNLIFTMREVRRVIAPNGLLLMSTPNLRSLLGLENFLFHNQAYSCEGDIYTEYDKLERLGHMGHVREYTTKEVATFLGKIGFRVEVLIFRGTYPSRKRRLLAHFCPQLRPFVTYVARAV